MNTQDVGRTLRKSRVEVVGARPAVIVLSWLVSAAKTNEIRYVTLPSAAHITARCVSTLSRDLAA